MSRLPRGIFGGVFSAAGGYTKSAAISLEAMLGAAETGASVYSMWSRGSLPVRASSQEAARSPFCACQPAPWSSPQKRIRARVFSAR